MLLQGIRAGLVHHVHAFHVFLDHAVIVVAEAHAGDFVELGLPPRFQLGEMHARRHLVHASAEIAEHALRLVLAARFSQGSSLQPDKRVGAENNRARMACRDLERFGPRIGRDQSGETQRGIVDFKSLCGIGLKLQTGRLQQFPASR